MSPATIIVAIVVIIAVAYFIHHIRGLFNGTASCCGNCSGSCSSSGKTKTGDDSQIASVLPEIGIRKGTVARATVPFLLSSDSRFMK